MDGKDATILMLTKEIENLKQGGATNATSAADVTSAAGQMKA